MNSAQSNLAMRKVHELSSASVCTALRASYTVIFAYCEPVQANAYPHLVTLQFSTPATSVTAVVMNFILSSPSFGAIAAKAVELSGPWIAISPRSSKSSTVTSFP